jgi:hypothetical protein
MSTTRLQRHRIVTPILTLAKSTEKPIHWWVKDLPMGNTTYVQLTVNNTTHLFDTLSSEFDMLDLQKQNPTLKFVERKLE